MSAERMYELSTDFGSVAFGLIAGSIGSAPVVVACTDDRRQILKTVNTTDVTISYGYLGSSGTRVKIDELEPGERDVIDLGLRKMRIAGSIVVYYENGAPTEGVFKATLF